MKIQISNLKKIESLKNNMHIFFLDRGSKSIDLNDGVTMSNQVHYIARLLMTYKNRVGSPNVFLSSSLQVVSLLKQSLCRVQTALPSVKNRALGKDLLCRVPHSAKNCTRQKRALGKGLLCRVPDSRQKRGTRHRVPRVTVFGHVLLCRVPAVRHSAKI